MRTLASMSTVTAGLFAMALFGAGACGGTTEQHPTEHGDDESHTQGVVTLDAGDLSELGIEVEVAGPGWSRCRPSSPARSRSTAIAWRTWRPGSAAWSMRSSLSLGDSVRGGQLLAVLESRELADAKAASSGRCRTTEAG